MNGRLGACAALASALVCAAPAGGCAGAAAERSRRAGSGSPGARGAPPEHTTAHTHASRTLGSEATFGDLIAAARRLDDAGAADSSAGCLIRAEGRPPVWRLEADVAVAVRPLPDAPVQLGTRLSDPHEKVRILSRWGQMGTDARRLVLTALTGTGPLRGDAALAVFLTRQGVVVRAVGAAAEPFAGPLPTEDAAGRLAAALSEAPVPLFVTAERDIPLEAVRELLASLPDDASSLVALAVPLAEGTRLPDAPGPTGGADGGAGLCPEGLPEPSSAEPRGELGARAIVAALGPLRAAASRCLDGAVGAAAAGGAVVLAARIGAGGRTTRACLVTDEVGDPTLRACLLDALRALRFPAPDPAGVVDFQLPLTLAAPRAPRQRPICP